MKVSLFNVNSLDNVPADVLEHRAWPLISTGDEDPTDEAYNPDGFVVAFNLPAPFDDIHVDVVVSVEDVQDLNIRFDDLVKTLPPVEARYSFSDPLDNVDFDDDGWDDDEFDYDIEDDYDFVCRNDSCPCQRTRDEF